MFPESQPLSAHPSPFLARGIQTSRANKLPSGLLEFHIETFLPVSRPQWLSEGWTLRPNLQQTCWVGQGLPLGRCRPQSSGLNAEPVRARDRTRRGQSPSSAQTIGQYRDRPLWGNRQWGWAGTYSSPKEKPDAPHYPGLPTLGAGCLGPSAVPTSRPHSLTGWAPQSYMDCFWVGESFVPKDGAVLPSKDATTQLCLHPLILDRLLTKPTWDDSLLWLSLKTDLWAPLEWLLTFRKYVLTLKPTFQQPLSSREHTGWKNILCRGKHFWVVSCIG